MALQALSEQAGAHTIVDSSLSGRLSQSLGSLGTLSISQDTVSVTIDTGVMRWAFEQWDLPHADVFESYSGRDCYGIAFDSGWFVQAGLGDVTHCPMRLPGGKVVSLWCAELPQDVFEKVAADGLQLTRTCQSLMADCLSAAESGARRDVDGVLMLPAVDVRFAHGWLQPSFVHVDCGLPLQVSQRFCFAICEQGARCMVETFAEITGAPGSLPEVVDKFFGAAGPVVMWFSEDALTIGAAQAGQVVPFAIYAVTAEGFADPDHDFDLHHMRFGPRFFQRHASPPESLLSSAGPGGTRSDPGRTSDR
ncbi:hypothetical protein [Corynebacterium aquilae]|uniref:Uncharacterized protein n=1 Tax=Corynebacterium aquilae DSM 44791 TaxID=1431546 RepID=A0A1L7CI11_9CORY|nr:hypothetical protein [Corynebacterium aquilae]APT85459.1 hypothetical protein CAQU_10805 [Corynebacterium aquilae DSM 44791]